MQHEEQDPRYHPQHWEQQQHRRHPYEPPHFQDFRSRWGEPMPTIPPQHGWHHEETDRFRRTGRFHREEWLPEQRFEHRHPPHMREPAWLERDAHFDPGNQRTEDRWHEDPLLPPPVRRPRRHYDGFWQDYED